MVTGKESLEHKYTFTVLAKCAENQCGILKEGIIRCTFYYLTDGKLSKDGTKHEGSEGDGGCIQPTYF